MWLARYDLLKRAGAKLWNWVKTHPGSIFGSALLAFIVQVCYICWHADQPATPERIKAVMAMNYCTKQLIPDYVNYYKDSPLTNEQVSKAIYDCKVAMEKWDAMQKQKEATK